MFRRFAFLGHHDHSPMIRVSPGHASPAGPPRRRRAWVGLERLEPRDLPAFGSGGLVLTTFGSPTARAFAGVVQATDQKILAVGDSYANGSNLNADFALARYNTNGSPDTTFNGSGMATTSFTKEGVYGNNAHAYAVAVQSDGKILVGGDSETYNSSTAKVSSTFALTRWNPNGTLDTTFGTKGKATTSFGGNRSSIVALFVRPDGRIVAIGDDTGSGDRVALARYNPNGTLDATFGSSGKVLINLGLHATSGVVEADGSLLVVGSASNQVALAHFTVSGKLDSSFGAKGVALTPVGQAVATAQAALQGDGKVVVSGSLAGANRDVLVARFNPDGAPDAAFGGGLGYVTTDLGADEEAKGVALQSDGKLVVTGNTTYRPVVPGPLVSRFVTARYNPDGTLDAGFGSAGVAQTSVRSSSAGNAIAVQANGSIVIFGESTQTTTSSTGSTTRTTAFAVGRYLASGALDDTTAAAPAGVSARSTPLLTRAPRPFRRLALRRGALSAHRSASPTGRFPSPGA